MKRVMLVTTVALLAVMTTSPAMAEPLPDLTVAKTGPERVSVGKDGSAPVTHHITVTNIGDAPVLIPDVDQFYLVRDVTYRRGQSRGGGAANLNSCPTQRPRPQVPEEVKEKVNLFLPSVSEECLEYTLRQPLAPGASQPHVLYVTYNMAGGGLVTNCATADPDNLIRESNEANNTDCLTTHVTR
jgi:CARDB